MLQYLVGVEGIVPDIITATSAGAIAATVLAQARTLPEFVDRVNEIEGDVLAWTQTEHVFGKQAWLGALDGTSLGREIHQEITEGTRPPFPLTPSTVLAGNEVVPAEHVGPQGTAPGPAGPAPAAAAHRPTGRRGRAPAAAGPAPPPHQRQRGPQPRPAGRCAPPRERGRGAGGRPRADRPPGPAAAPGRHRAAGRRPALRVRGRHHRGVRRPHPCARGRRRARSTSSTAPSRRPACPWSSRRTRWPTTTTSTAGVIEIVPVSAAAALGATRIIAVVAVPLALPRDERDYAAAPAGYIGLRSMGMIGVAERQISNLNVPLPEGSALTTIDPVVDVVGLFEVEPGLLRINKDYGWLRAADVMAEGDAGIAAGDRRGHPRHRRGPARGLAPRGVALGRRAGREPTTPGRWLSSASTRRRSARWSTGASSSASPCPTAVRTGGPATRPTRPSARRACRPSRRGATDHADCRTVRPSGRPSSPAGGTAR